MLETVGSSSSESIQPTRNMTACLIQVYKMSLCNIPLVLSENLVPPNVNFDGKNENILVYFSKDFIKFSTILLPGPFSSCFGACIGVYSL